MEQLLRLLALSKLRVLFSRLSLSLAFAISRSPLLPRRLSVIRRLPFADSERERERERESREREAEREERARERKREIERERTWRNRRWFSPVRCSDRVWEREGV